MSALDDKITDFVDSVNKAAQYAKGSATTDVQTPSGPIPSIAKQYAQYQNLINGLTPDISNRLRVDADGGYTEQQKTQARTNIGLDAVANLAPADLPISDAAQDALNELGELTLGRENPINKNRADGYAGLQGQRIVLMNDAGTVLCTIATQATTGAEWTMPSKSGTVAMLDDITGNNSGNNTGDETTATIKAKLSISVLTGNNTGDETNASILGKLGLTSISGVNTGDETQQSILSKLPFSLIDPAILDQASGIAVLNANRLVEYERLPSSVKNLTKVAALGDLPATGNVDTIYLVTDDGTFFHWDGTQYAPAGTNTLGSTDQLAEGQDHLYYTDERVMAAPVALEPSNGDEVGNGDTLTTALSKLGAKDRNLQQDINARESLSNKATDFTVVDDTKYPSVKAVKTAISAAVSAALVNVVIDCGSFDAVPGLFPTTGGSGVGGAVMKGNLFFVASPGTVGGKAVNIGDSIRALVDNPGQTAANWDQLESNIGYVPYNATNPAGYTANFPDNYLLDRANHTGTQSADTVDESSTRVWITPAQRTAIGHANRAALDLVSGTNTGDQTLASLAAQGTASKDANGGYVGLTAFKINTKNSDGSVTSFITNVATAARTYTFPDKDGTVATLTDITGINSGTNTGDETTGSIQTKLAGQNIAPATVNATGNVNITSAAPTINLIESDQSGTGGVWRFVADGNQLRMDMNTAAARDMSTYVSPFAINDQGVVQFVQGVNINTNANASGNGTNLFLRAGAGSTGGGAAQLTAGAGTAGNANGGNVSIQAGAAVGTGTAGSVVIAAGANAGGTGGNVSITAPAGVTIDTSLAVAGNAVATVVTAELKANKASAITTQSDDTMYPSVKAVKAYVDALGLGGGVLIDCGGYDASTNVFPTTGGTGTSGAVKKGNLWFVSVPGTLAGLAVAIGDSFRALVDNPGQTASNWDVMETNIGYVPAKTDGTNATGNWPIGTTGSVKFNDATGANTTYYLAMGDGVAAQTTLKAAALSYNPSTGVLGVNNLQSTAGLTLKTTGANTIGMYVNGVQQVEIGNTTGAVSRLRLRGGISGVGSVVEVISSESDAHLILNAQGAGQIIANYPLSIQNGVVTSEIDKGIQSTASATVTFNVKAGSIQKLTIAAATTIATSGWAASGGHADLLIELVNGGSSAVTFSGISWILPTTGAPAASFSAYLTAIGRSPASLQSSGTDWIYLWSTNGGTTINGKVV